MYMTDSFSSVREWQSLFLSVDYQRLTHPGALNTSTPGPCHYVLQLHTIQYLSKAYLS